MRLISSQDEWENLYQQCGKQHLSQSWAFGEAKRRAENWHPRRVAFEYARKVVAICMILEKRVCGVRVVSRINKGPLFIGLSPSRQICRDVISNLRNEWKYLIHGVLLIAPSLESNAEQLEMLANSGFHKWTRFRWRSSLIDLRRDESDIRKALKQKWRYNLHLAEKKGLALNVASAKEDVEWMLERHRENMATKRFKGPSPELLRALYHEKPEHFFVLQALFENQPVVGMILVKHGYSAEYYVGWFGPSGRKLNAGNFLFWKAVVAMKEQGCRWLDLGGYSIDDRYGRFKREMNGEEYQLCGEYICI